MDIRNWPIDKIMQLPDYCFGQRWLIGLASTASDIGPSYDISEMALPEWTVIWNLCFWYLQIDEKFMAISLALGDNRPTTEAEFERFEVLFRDFAYYTAPRREFQIMPAGGSYNVPMRKIVHTAGRRLVGRLYYGATGVQYATVILTISSIPTEVPDCLLSGLVRGR